MLSIKESHSSLIWTPTCNQKSLQEWSSSRMMPLIPLEQFSAQPTLWKLKKTPHILWELRSDLTLWETVFTDQLMRATSTKSPTFISRSNSAQPPLSIIALAALSSLTLSKRVPLVKLSTWSSKKDMKFHQCKCSLSTNQQQRNSSRYIKVCSLSSSAWSSKWPLAHASF